MSYRSAVEEYRKALAAAQVAPTDPTAQFNVGWYASRVGDSRRAIEAYERALALGVSAPEEALLNIASVYSEQLADPDRAIAALRRAIDLREDYTGAWFNLGHIAEQVGDRLSARDYFERVLSLEPDHPTALARLADASEPAPNAPFIAKLRAAAAHHEGEPDLCYALARQEESLGDYTAAWRALVAANQRDAHTHPPLPKGLIANWQQTCRDRAMRPLPDITPEATAPVFVCGMFRTGSTLLEQMLAAHPRFAPLGESDFWPRRVASLGGGMVLPAELPRTDVLARWREAYYRHAADRLGKVPRFTDKRPDNLYQLSLIAHALPEARFVITDRDWRDVMLSVYGTRLHPQHHYAVDLNRIRSQLALVNAMVEGWQAHSAQRIYRLRYEALVADPKGAMTHLLGWLGEDWDECVLGFHQLSNSVRTASVWQVREPLGADRIARWRRFEAPLRKTFGESLDDPNP